MGTSTEPNSTDDSSDGNSGERHSDKGPSSVEAKIEENDADYEESTNNDDIDRLSVTSISVTVASLAALSDIADPLGDLQSLACPIGTPMKREAVDNTDSKSDVSSYCREPLRKKAAV